MKSSYLNAQHRKATPEQYKHDLGQHFLYDQALLRQLVEETGLTPREDVLEIGPGEGTLTEVLCNAARNVVSVEVDSVLIPLLNLMKERHSNLTVVEGDIRKVSFSEITAPLEKPFHVIANIPYNITSPILDIMWKHSSDICQLSLMVQKEVALKLTAKPGDETYGISSVTAQYYADCHIAQIIPASFFTPPPKVDSAFIILKIRKERPWQLENEGLFFSLVKAGFTQRRKTLSNALKVITADKDIPAVLESLDLNPKSRAEDLSVSQWAALTGRINQLRKA